MREALSLDTLRALEPRDAAALIVVRRGQGLGAEEEELIARWLREDPNHSAALNRATQAWDCFEDAADDEILSAIRAQALQPARGRLPNWRAAAAAAVAILCIGATLVVTLAGGWGTRSPQDAADEALRYASARGEVRRVELPDGSVMTLDAESAALVRFNPSERSVQLERGRALFEIAADKARRFAVVAGERRIVAVGTRFDVNLVATGLIVTLGEGRVTVGPVDSSRLPVTLRPGQQFVERGGRRVLREISAEAGAMSEWRRGVLSFDDTSLAEAAVEVNRHSREQILVRNAEVAALRVSGRFRASEAQRFAQTVAEIHPVRLVSSGSTIELVPSR